MNLKELNKFLIQSHRIAPSVTPMQIAIMMVMFRYKEPSTLQEISNELGIKPARINRHIRPLLDQTGRDLISMKGWNCLSLTNTGDRYCRMLISNTEYFFNIDIEI